MVAVEVKMTATALKQWGGAGWSGVRFRAQRRWPEVKWLGRALLAPPMQALIASWSCNTRYGGGDSR